MVNYLQNDIVSSPLEYFKIYFVGLRRASVGKACKKEDLSSYPQRPCKRQTLNSNLQP